MYTSSGVIANLLALCTCVLVALYPAFLSASIGHNPFHRVVNQDNERTTGWPAYDCVFLEIPMPYTDATLFRPKPSDGQGYARMGTFAGLRADIGLLFLSTTILLLYRYSSCVAFIVLLLYVLFFVDRGNSASSRVPRAAADAPLAI